MMLPDRISLINVFEECANRLNQGESIADCLNLYPEYGDQLRGMLETSLAAKRGLIVSPVEVLQAKDRVRSRLLAAQVEAASNAARFSRARRTTYRLLFVAASFMLVFMIVIVLVAENSLPGDPLFGLKLFNESVRLSLNHNPDLRRSMEQRRIDEVRLLLDQGRSEEVAFIAMIDTVNETTLTAAGFMIQYSVATPGAALVQVGRRVQIQGRTQPDGTVLALVITEPDDDATETPIPVTPGKVATETLAATSASAETLTDVPSMTSTPTVTATVTTTAVTTATAAATSTATQSVTPTATPSATRTLTRTMTTTPTRTATATRTATPTGTRTMTPTADVTPTMTPCVAVRPEGWITYSVKPGDTLSGLAAATGTTLQILIRVNCITNPGLLMNGQPLYLPMLPVEVHATEPGDDNGGITPTAGVPDDNGGGDDNGGDDNGGDNGGSGGGSDDNGSDDSGSGGGSDDNGGDDNGSGGSGSDDDN